MSTLILTVCERHLWSFNVMCIQPIFKWYKNWDVDDKNKQSPMRPLWCVSFLFLTSFYRMLGRECVNLALLCASTSWFTNDCDVLTVWRTCIALSIASCSCVKATSPTGMMNGLDSLCTGTASALCRTETERAWTWWIGTKHQTSQNLKQNWILPTFWIHLK